MLALVLGLYLCVYIYRYIYLKYIYILLKWLKLRFTQHKYLSIIKLVLCTLPVTSAALRNTGP